MEAMKFIKERNRMCDYYGSYTSGCRKNEEICPGRKCKCNGYWVAESDDFKIVDIVKQWSEKHPQKTMLQDFLEKFPNAPLDNDGIPSNCPQSLGYCSDAYCGIHPIGKICVKCWSRPLEE